MHLRMRDFVLVREESGEAFMQKHFPIGAPIPSGNGLPFMQFIRQEFIPSIEADYRADPYQPNPVRPLDWGELRALHPVPPTGPPPTVCSGELRSRPGPRRGLRREQRQPSRPTPPDIGRHNQQDFAGPRSLVDRLKSRRYAGLQLTHETIVSTHCAMVPYAYQSGLVQVFSNRADLQNHRDSHHHGAIAHAPPSPSSDHCCHQASKLRSCVPTRLTLTILPAASGNRTWVIRDRETAEVCPWTLTSWSAGL